MPSFNNWLNIWNGRTAVLTNEASSSAEASVLRALMHADGFDVLGAINESAWSEYVERVAKRLGVESDDCLFEVGCGAGAFLYPFYCRTHAVAGADYSAGLIESARQAMPQGQFMVAEAAQLPTHEQFDYVIANGVFLYFPDHAYAANVLRWMLSVARKGVAILDVPDILTQEASLTVRRGKLGVEEYNQKYRGLEHLHFAREWFQPLMKEFSADILIQNQDIKNYNHSPFRFNVFARRGGLTSQREVL